MVISLQLFSPRELLLNVRKYFFFHKFAQKEVTYILVIGELGSDVIAHLSPGLGSLTVEIALSFLAVVHFLKFYFFASRDFVAGRILNAWHIELATSHLEVCIL
jgi:hypothetical protein